MDRSAPSSPLSPAPEPPSRPPQTTARRARARLHVSLKEVTDVRMSLNRARPDQRPRRKRYDHARAQQLRERTWLDASRYRVHQ